MRKLKTFVLSLILVSGILIGTRFFLCYADESYQASVEDISGDKYFPAVKGALSKAEKSIYIVLCQLNNTTILNSQKNGKIKNTNTEFANGKTNYKSLS